MPPAARPVGSTRSSFGATGSLTVTDAPSHAREDRADVADAVGHEGARLIVAADGEPDEGRIAAVAGRLRVAADADERWVCGMRVVVPRAVWSPGGPTLPRRSTRCPRARGCRARGASTGIWLPAGALSSGLKWKHASDRNSKSAMVAPAGAVKTIEHRLPPGRERLVGLTVDDHLARVERAAPVHWPKSSGPVGRRRPTSG